MIATTTTCQRFSFEDVTGRPFRAQIIGTSLNGLLHFSPCIVSVTGMEQQNLHQRVRACQALLSLMGYSHLWDVGGPSSDAKKFLDEYGGPMSKSQWVLYQVVWHVWGRPSDVKLQEVMQLPAPHSQWVLSLLDAMLRGSGAVEAWLNAIQKFRTARGKKRLRIHRLA